MNRESIDNWVERSILGMVLAALGFGVLGFGAVRPQEFVVVWWLILGATGLWLARIWTAPKFRFLWTPACWGILPFVGYAVWRYTNSDVEILARRELIQVLVAALLFLLIINNLYSQESTRLLGYGLVFLSMVVAMYGIYQWLKESNSVWGLSRDPSYLGRASGSYICPNHLAGLMEMVAPLGLCLVVCGRMPVVLRILLGYATLGILAGVGTSLSRAGWICAGLTLTGLLLVLIRGQRKRWVGLAVLALILAGGYWFYSRSVATRVQHTYVSGHEKDLRLRIWDSAWRMWKDHPWTGVGQNHFDTRYRLYRQPVDKTQNRPDRVHNDFLNTLVDYGAIGLGLFLLPLFITGWVFKRFWSHLQRDGGDLGQRKKSNRTALILGTITGLTALVLHSFLDFNMHIPANALVAATLFALLNTQLRFATERFWFTARWPLAVAASVILGGALFYMVPLALNGTREVVQLRAAANAVDGSEVKIQALKAAFALEPANYETAYLVAEQLRALAWTGADGYKAQAREAIEWYEKVSRLNRWDSLNWSNRGMCYERIDRPEEALTALQKGVAMDPNYWYPYAATGWFEFQHERYASCHEWMTKSLALLHSDRNTFAFTYLVMCEKLMRGDSVWPTTKK